MKENQKGPKHRGIIPGLGYSKNIVRISRLLDKSAQIKDSFSYFSTKTYVVGCSKEPSQ